jgi:hypothetical protein
VRDDALLSLHLWRDAEADTPWRARLTDLRGGGTTTFQDVPALVRYLSAAFATAAGGADVATAAARSPDAGSDRDG